MQQLTKNELTPPKPSEEFPGTAYLSVCGMRIRYKKGGFGDQILLLHGWGGSIESMETVFNSLVRHSSVFVIDFPGHGESGMPPHPWSVSDYCECVLDIMNTLQLRHPHIIAHSFGGRVAIKLAAEHPDRIGKIVLVDSAGVRPRRSWRYYSRLSFAKIGKLLVKFGGELGQTARDRIYARVASADYVNSGPLRGTFVRVVNEDLTKLLPRISSPTLLVWGAKDTDTPVSSARVMKRLIPNAELVVFENAGHFSYVDESNRFSLITGRFLRG